MKKILVISFIVTAFTCCKKEGPVDDYRSIFIGQYSFVVEEHSAHGATPADMTYHDTTYTSQGLCAYNDVNKLLVMLPLFQFEGLICENGTLGDNRLPYILNGKFESDGTVSFVYHPQLYSHSYSVFYEVTGTKIH